MSAEWIGRVILATTLLCIGAFAAEQIAAWFARPRRWIWLGAMVSAIALPIVVARAPHVMPVLGLETKQPDPHFSAPPMATELAWSRATNVEPGASPVLKSPINGTPDWFVLWAFASSSLLMVALCAAGRLMYLRRRARPAVIDGVPVLVTDDLGPLVTGLFAPAILVPAWASETRDPDRRLMLAHEQQHIGGGDHWLAPIGAMLVILMPWNPVVWLMFARLRLAIETDCDARVIAGGADCLDYGSALIRVAGKTYGHSALSPAWRTRAWQLEYRVRAMTLSLPKARAGRAMVMGVGAALFVAIACDAATPDLEVTAARETRTSARPLPLNVVTSVPREEYRRNSAQSRGRDLTLVAAQRGERGSERQQPMSRFVSVGNIRVTGLTRPTVKARLRFDGLAGRFRVVSGRLVRTVGDTIVDVITPVEVTVDGDATYRIVAESQEGGAELEVTGMFPLGEGFPMMQSARGSAPEIRFPGSQRVARAIEARHAAMVSFQRLQPTPIGQPRIAPYLSKGQILLEAEYAPVQVHVRIADGVEKVDGTAVTFSDEFITATTPITLTIKPNSDFSVVFSPVDSTSRIRAVVNGTVEAPFRGSANTIGAIVVCGRLGGGGRIGSAKWGSSPSGSCK